MSQELLKIANVNKRRFKPCLINTNYQIYKNELDMQAKRNQTITTGICVVNDF